MQIANRAQRIASKKTTTPDSGGFSEEATTTRPPRTTTRPPRTTTARTNPPQTTRPSGPPGPPDQCKIWGDPQVISFDGLASANFRCNGKWYKESTVDSYKDGDYYLVKSSEIEVQGRFGSGMGTTFSMQRELAVKVGGEVLQIKPHSIWFQGDQIASGNNQGLSGVASGGFTVEKSDSGMMVQHEDVNMGIWVQQVGSSAPAVNAIIIASKGVLSDVSGLCGDGDGDASQDCDFMINDASKVPDGSSLFAAAPFDFAGCATAGQVRYEWRAMHAVSNADTCALQCKGFGKHTYYPEFYIKKSHTQGLVDCYCANLAESQKTAWKAYAMSPSELAGLPKDKGSCSADACSAVTPTLRSDAICVFKEHEKATPKECSARENASYKRKCESDGFSGVELSACIIDQCASGGNAQIEEADKAFSRQAQAAQGWSWKWSWKSSGGTTSTTWKFR